MRLVTPEPHNDPELDEPPVMPDLQRLPDLRHPPIPPLIDHQTTAAADADYQRVILKPSQGSPRRRSPYARYSPYHDRHLPPACIRDIRPTMVSTGHFYEFQNSTPIIRRSRWQCGCPDDLHNPHDLSPPSPSRRFTGKTSCALVLQKTCISNKQFSTMAVRPLHVIPTWSTRETNTSPRGPGRTILESRNSHRDVFR